MYHAIVKQRVKSLFNAVNAANFEPVINMFAPQFEHVFVADNALGGTRRSVAATREWYARLHRLLPGLKFDVKSVRVAGTPWNTLILAEWNESNSGADGVVTSNRGTHTLHLKWGKATKLVISTDTTGLQATLDRLAAKGFAEAHAPPITS